MSSASASSGLHPAVEALLRLHRRRRWILRALVVATGLMVLVVLPLLVFAPLGAAAAILLLPSFWAGYLLADSALISLWRARAIASWRAGTLNLGVFAEAVTTLPMLPRASTAAVLRALPVLSPLRDRDLSPPQRDALAALSDCHWADENLAALLPAALIGLLSGATAAAMLVPHAANAGSALLVLGLLCLLILTHIGLPVMQCRRLSACIAALAPAEQAALAHDLRAHCWPGAMVARWEGAARGLLRDNDKGRL